MIEKIVKSKPVYPAEPNTAFLVDNITNNTYTRYVSDKNGYVKKVVSEDVIVGKQGIKVEEVNGKKEVTFDLSEENPVTAALKDVMDEKILAASTKIDSKLNNYTLKGTFQGVSSDLKREIDNLVTLVTSDDSTLTNVQEIVNYIKLNRSTLDSLSIASIAGLQEALDNKVNTVLNKSLSEENFSTDLKEKLENINTNLYLTKGNFLGTAETLNTSIESLTSKLEVDDQSLNTLQKVITSLKQVSQSQETFSNSLESKVDKDGDKVLSDNNFSNDLKSKLETLDTSLYTLRGGYAGSSQDIVNLITPLQIKLQSNDSNLDTLQEIVDYIKNLNTSLSNKVNTESGKGLSSNDFTTALKQKLEGISTETRGTVYTGNTNVPADQATKLITYDGRNDGTLNFNSFRQKDWCIIRNETDANGICRIEGEKNGKVIKKDEVAILFKWDVPEIILIAKQESNRDYISEIGGSSNANKNLSTDASGMISISQDPTSNNHIVRKSYVDNYKPSIIKTVDNTERKIKEITQSQYDTLTTKDSDTFYFIIN